MIPSPFPPHKVAKQIEMPPHLAEGRGLPGQSPGPTSPWARASPWQTSAFGRVGGQINVIYSGPSTHLDKESVQC